MIELANLGIAVLLAATSTAASAEVKPAEAPEKMICRKYDEVGSLVKKKRVCHTRADWRRIDDASRRGVQEIQDARNGTNTSN